MIRFKCQTIQVVLLLIINRQSQMRAATPLLIDAWIPAFAGMTEKVGKIDRDKFGENDREWMLIYSPSGIFSVIPIHSQ